MNRLEFIVEEFQVIKVVKERTLPMPGFKFAIGDKVKLVGPMSYLNVKRNEETIVTCCGISEFMTAGEKVYGFTGDVRPNYLYVEKNFELVEEEPSYEIKRVVK